ncbi:hypothetical protein [Ferruginibacter sp. SUN106]|uniref:hypothetical protein n=1 Tax=Ferruginibacter sp. SUN106 TaxID=2978348 RepID=UPI003D369E83
MPDEEIDKVVRDAANQHHPPYDDEAWGKMEVLLDKHLPQKKDRKKPVLFWLVFLLLGSAVFFAIKNSDKNNTAATATATQEKKSGGTADATASTAATQGNKNPADKATPGNTIANQQPNAIPVAATTVITNTTVKNNLEKKITQVQVDDNNNQEQYVAAKKNGYNQKGRSSIRVKKPGAVAGDDDLQTQKEKDELVKEKADEPAQLPATVKNDDIINKDVNTTADKKDIVITKADTASKAKPEAEKNVADEKTKTATNVTKKNKKSFTDKIAVTVSAGGDLSFIELSNAGKLKPAYGAGLSYAIGKHIVVSSGFYVSKKIYSATPYQYKFSGYGAPPNLKEIGADCKVFEIPVSVYYSSRQVKNHNWLAGAGLSSLLMKSESYDYRYQTPTGQAYNYKKTITNENKHYFSVLTISGGYQYKLNNRLSFIAEPYIKIPLKGIGLGEIKLNSTGLLITAAIKPFAKKK